MEVIKPPNHLDVIPQQWAAMMDAIDRLAPVDRYQHWNELRLEPVIQGVSHEAWWAALKVTRLPRLRAVGPRGKTGFLCGRPEALDELFHELDRCGPGQLAEVGEEDRFSRSALLREAVGSAALAGSVVKLEEAREAIRAGRPPRNVDERVVLNLFGALVHLRGLARQPLTRVLLQDLHRRITADTLEPGVPGRLRRAGESAAQEDYLPPPPDELPDRLDQLCAFANGAPAGSFLHPVIRAVVLHFWLAHDRPFADGNGRTARALFYWSVWRQGYDLFALVPLSPRLAGDPERYARAFRETETDDYDLTYFVLHQGEAIRAGLRAARERRDRKQGRLQEGSRQGRVFNLLNRRQQAVICRALHEPETVFGIARHQHSHGVTHQTARDDLFDLVRRDLLTVTRERRIYRFRAAADLAAGLQAPAGRRRGARTIATDEGLPTSLL